MRKELEHVQESDGEYSFVTEARVCFAGNLERLKCSLSSRRDEGP